MRNINNTNPKRAVYYDLLRKTINSIYFYVEIDEKEDNNDKKFYHYFQGKKNECSFISSSSFYSKRLSKIHIVYKDNKLWYEEGEIFGKNLDYLDLNHIPLDKRVLIMDNLKNVSFSYLSGKKEFQELFKKIPSLINITIQDQVKTRIYTFITKSDNNKHLEKIIADNKEVF
jgi:hypothetical protein